MKLRLFFRFSSFLLFVTCVASQQYDDSPEAFVSDEGFETFATPSPDPIPKPRRDAKIQSLYLMETPNRTYYVTVGIGNPAQFLRLLLHSGVSDVWVRTCHSYLPFECLTQTSYWPSHSDTASKEIHWKEYDLEFHPSMFVAGHLAIDHVQLGNKTIQDQAIAAFDRVYHTSSGSNTFNNHEGFFGLGNPNRSLLGRKTFIKNMFEQNLIEKKMISIYLRKVGGGELLLGGIDPNQHESDHEWVQLSDADDGRLKIQLEDLYMRNAVHTCDNMCDVAISTITSHIAGPPDIINRINNYLLSSSSKKPRVASQSCAERVRTIVEDCFRNKEANSVSTEEMCLSVGWCERSHLQDHQSFASRKLLEQDVRNFKHSFGCAACMSIAESVQELNKLEDYDPEFGASLCNWLSQLQTEISNDDDTEEIDCDAISTFSLLRISANGHYFHLDSPFYIYKRVHPNLTITCHSEFIPYEGSDTKNWIFGTSFLRAFHTVIDYENKRIGFATPAK